MSLSIIRENVVVYVHVMMCYSMSFDIDSLLDSFGIYLSFIVAVVGNYHYNNILKHVFILHDMSQ